MVSIAACHECVLMPAGGNISSRAKASAWRSGRPPSCTTIATRSARSAFSISGNALSWELTELTKGASVSFVSEVSTLFPKFDGVDARGSSYRYPQRIDGVDQGGAAAGFLQSRPEELVLDQHLQGRLTLLTVGQVKPSHADTLPGPRIPCLRPRCGSSGEVPSQQPIVRW